MAGTNEPATTELPVDVDLVSIDPEAREVIESCLRLARERLGMEISWLAEIGGGRKVFRVVEGDRDDWELWDGSWLPDTESYCLRMLDGQIPNAIRDAAAEPAVASLDVTRRLRIGSYIGVPLVLPGGEVRGAFCCARHTADAELGERDVRFLQVLARLIADELAFRESQREVRRLERTAASIGALLSALDARDNYTGDHSRTVVELAAGAGRRLDLDEDGLALLEQVALLHDIGKVAIPDAILCKPGPLDAEETEIMRTHPAVGAEIVARQPDLAHLAPSIRAEHERWDGEGYPDGLAGEAIPVASRIVLVADAFHAMVSRRPYRAAMSQDEAIAELRRCSGSMFWPDAVEALVAELDSDDWSG